MRNGSSHTQEKLLPGFTLIEAMIFLFIFMVSTVAMYQGFNVATNYIIDSKKKLQAVELANEQIEQKRNLGYENLTPGTEEDVEVVRNGINYKVTTRITEFDDEEDDLAPTDEISWDYYKIGVEVGWGNDRHISMSAIVVPPIREEDADKGYMRLHVIDQNGDGLGNDEQPPHVAVRKLSNNSLIYSGPINTSGIMFLTGLVPGSYKISVSDEHDYYPIETIGSDTLDDPYEEHAEIAGKTLLEKYLQTDLVSSLELTIRDVFGNTISGLGFDIWGGKYLGIDGGEDVYSYSGSKSNSDGTESFSYGSPAGFGSFGPHYFSFTDLNDGTTDYTFLWMMAYDSVAGTDTKGDMESKVMLPAGTSLSAKAVLAPNNVPSLLITVEDSVDKAPIAEASVRMQFSDTPAYDLTLTTDQFGKAYFPLASGELINDEYDLTVNADGYDEKTDTVTIDDFTTKTVELTPNP